MSLMTTERIEERMAAADFRLVYASEAAHGLSDEDIAGIINASQSNNYERHLTGFLAHNGDAFMQVLEGPEDEVRRTFAAIAADVRHRGVIQLVGERIKGRAFQDWAMNYHRVDQIGGGMVVRCEEAVEDLMPHGAPRDLLYLFSQFIHLR